MNLNACTSCATHTCDILIDIYRKGSLDYEARNKFGTKEQLAIMKKGSLDQVNNAPGSRLIKWMIAHFIVMWSMLALIAFKLFSH